MSDYKIATLLPSATELVAEIGLADSIVCISHECDTPAQIKHLPKVTSCNLPNDKDQRLIDELVKASTANGRSLYEVQVSLLKELDVSHIVTQGICDVCAVSPELIEANLRGNQYILSSKIEIISLCGTTIDGIFEDIKTLSKIFNKIDVGKRIIETAENKIINLINPLPKEMTVLMLEWLDPPYYAGHWVPEQIELAGFKCAIGSKGKKSKVISWNEIIKIDPDFIGVIACGGNLNENQKYANTLFEMEILSNLKAIKNKNVFAFDANKFFSRPTLRVIDGIELLKNELLK